MEPHPTRPHVKTATTAIKSAVDAGDYERAAKLLDVMRTTPCFRRD